MDTKQSVCRRRGEPPPAARLADKKNVVQTSCCRGKCVPLSHMCCVAVCGGMVVEVEDSNVVKEGGVVIINCCRSLCDFCLGMGWDGTRFKDTGGRLIDF